MIRQILCGFEHKVFVIVDLEYFTNKVIGLIPREESGEEYLSIDSSNGDGVVENYSVLPLLHLNYVLLRNLEESIAKEDIVRIEFGMEADSVIGHEQLTTQDNLITQATFKSINHLLPLLEHYLRL